MKERHPSYLRALKHFNEPVLDMFRVVRLIGWGQDEHDSYYIYQAAGGEVYRSSTVGGFIPLDRLGSQDTPDGIRHALENPARNDFEQLSKWLALNGAPPAEVFWLEEPEAGDEPSFP